MKTNTLLFDSILRTLLSLLAFSFLQIAAAQSPSTPMFEVASVKPAPQRSDPNTGHWSPPGTGRFNAAHVPLALLIHLAYGVDNSQIANRPGWLDTNLYDIDAKAEDGISLTRDELKPRLQDLLHQRFHLVAHSETRLGRGYALVLANHGLHLTPTKAEHFPGYRINLSPGQMRGANWSMSQFAKYLTPVVGFPVIDQTGLTGSYDIAFSYDPKPEADGDLPSLEEALRQATGLQLKPHKIPVETLVIDSIDKVPTAK